MAEHAGTSWKSTYSRESTMDNLSPGEPLPETDRYKLLVKEELPVNCYQFTWLGPYDSTNKTESCSYAQAMGQPCFEPLVWTEGETQM